MSQLTYEDFLEAKKRFESELLEFEKQRRVFAEEQKVFSEKCKKMEVLIDSIQPASFPNNTDLPRSPSNFRWSKKEKVTLRKNSLPPQRKEKQQQQHDSSNLSNITPTKNYLQKAERRKSVPIRKADSDLIMTSPLTPTSPLHKLPPKSSSYRSIPVDKGNLTGPEYTPNGSTPLRKEKPFKKKKKDFRYSLSYFIDQGRN